MSNKVVLFTCNWNAYSSLETAGAKRLNYPASVLPFKVACLGQIEPGTILKAFEYGADGVLMLGCPPGECHYEFGNRRVEEVFSQARELTKVLGYNETQLQLDWVAAGEGHELVNKILVFIAGLNEMRRQR